MVQCGVLWWITTTAHDHYCTPGYVLDEFQDHVASSKAGIHPLTEVLQVSLNVPTVRSHARGWTSKEVVNKPVCVAHETRRLQAASLSALKCFALPSCSVCTYYTYLHHLLSLR